MTDEPEKVDLETPDLAAENRAALAALFPGVLADGLLDAAKLGELLDIPVAQAPDGRERYGLQWASKQAAVRSLLTPSRGTLVPEVDKSIGFDDAKNVFIEGDNLEVLKLIQKAYNNKIKLIYIDPPYNTGTDFIYRDDYSDGLRGYLGYTGQLDQDGNRVAANTEIGGRRHSRWLSMMYSRMLLARNLLAEDGGIFVSIDFNEVHNLRLLMDEVFGEDSFQREVIWRIGWLSGYKTMANNFIRNHDTMLFYSRSPEKLGFVKKYIENASFKPLVKRDKNMNAKLDELGLSKTQQNELIEFINHGNRPDRYPIEDTWNSNEYDDLNSIAIVSFSGEKISKLLDVDEEYKGQKSVKMLQRVIESMTTGDDIVLDFFAGSGSTAHAVMQLNSEDGGRRRCISVNIQEPLSVDSGARDAGYETVTDLAVARIKKVMSLIPGASNMGLRVLRLAPSNFRVATEGDELDLADSTLALNGTDWQSIAAEVLLKEGVSLDQPWARHKAAGAEVVVADGVAVVLSDAVDSAMVEAALKLAPRVVVFMENGFAGADAVKANAFTNAKNAGITMKTV
ncbi:site-specific DNA-methyltransferase [Geodermatophilus sp. SYSU D00708]